MEGLYPKPTDPSLFALDAPKDLDSSEYAYPPETLELGSIYGNMASIAAKIPELNDFSFLSGRDGGSQEDTTMEDIQPSPRGADHVSNVVSPGTFSFNQFNCPPPGPDFTLFSGEQPCDSNAFPQVFEREMADTATVPNYQQNMETQLQNMSSSLPASFLDNSPSLNSQNSGFRGEQK